MYVNNIADNELQRKQIVVTPAGERGFGNFVSNRTNTNSFAFCQTTPNTLLFEKHPLAHALTHVPRVRTRG